MKNKESLEQLNINEKQRYQEHIVFSNVDAKYLEMYDVQENKKCAEFATDDVLLKNTEISKDKTSNNETLKMQKTINTTTAVVSSFAAAVVGAVIIFASIILNTTFNVHYKVDYQLYYNMIEFMIEFNGDENYQSSAHLYTDDLTYDVFQPLEYGSNVLVFGQIEKIKTYNFEIICNKLDSEETQIFEQQVITYPDNEQYIELIFIESFSYGFECMLFVEAPEQCKSYAIIDGLGDDFIRELEVGEGMVWFDNLRPDTEYVVRFIILDNEKDEITFTNEIKLKTKEVE